MRSRRRALAFLIAAGASGLLAVSLAGGYSSSVAETYGELRPVVVLTRGLAPGRVISSRVAETGFEVREVPSRFLPSAAIADPMAAIGLVPAAPLPAGSYLTAPLLRPPRDPEANRPAPGRGRHAVEISVAGAGALSGAGKVDVLVTTDDGRGGGGTRVAARSVPLIAIGRTGQSDAGPGLTEVTLGLTRRQAVDLIDAESFARRITVLPRAGG